MFNLELKSNDPERDDLFWIDNETGIVSHNCLPKDTADLYRCCEEAGVDAGILREVIERNERTRAGDSKLARVNLAADFKTTLP